MRTSATSVQPGVAPSHEDVCSSRYLPPRSGVALHMRTYMPPRSGVVPHMRTSAVLDTSCTPRPDTPRLHTAPVRHSVSRRALCWSVVSRPAPPYPSASHSAPPALPVAPSLTIASSAPRPDTGFPFPASPPPPPPAPSVPMPPIILSMLTNTSR